MQSLQTLRRASRSISPTAALTAASFPPLEAPTGTVAQAESKHISWAQSPHPRPGLCLNPWLPRSPTMLPALCQGHFGEQRAQQHGRSGTA